VQLDARQSNPPRERQRTLWEFMQASRASPRVPRGVRESCHAVPQPSRLSPRTLPTGHGHGSAAATRETGGIYAADVARVASWSTSGATTAATYAPERAVPVVVLPAVERLPTALAYTSIRRSWRRVEGVASFKHTPYLGDTDDAHAAAASIMDKNGWTAADCNSDGSDASDDEPTHLGNRYHSLEERIFRMAQRAGVYAVVHALGDSPTVVHTLSEVLGQTLPHMTHVAKLVQQRGDDHRRAVSEREAQATRQAALKQLKGGASLAVVLASGAGREQGGRVAGLAFPTSTSGALEARVRAAPAAFGASTSAAAASAADVAAARLPPLSRVWALRQAELVRQEHTESDAMRNDAAAVRMLRTVVRAHGGAEAAAHLPSVGTSFGAGHAAPTGSSVGGPTVAVADEVQLPQRGLLVSLLCRVCLRNTCKLHGAPDGDPLAGPLPLRPVGLPRGADGADADKLAWPPRRARGDTEVAPVAPRDGSGARFSSYFGWAEATGLHVGPRVDLRVSSAVADARRTDVGPDAGCRGRPPVTTGVAESVSVAPRDGDFAGRFVDGTRRATAGGTGSPDFSNVVGASVGDGSAVAAGTPSVMGDADAPRPPTIHAEDAEVSGVDDVWHGRRCLLTGVGGAPESTTRQSQRRPVGALSAV